MSRSWRTAGIAAAYVAVMLPVTASAEVQIGMVFQPEYKGAIGQLPTGGEHELHFSEPIYAEEVVLTDARASTALEFLDKTQLRVGTNSTVKLDKFIYDPSHRRWRGSAELRRRCFPLCLRQPGQDPRRCNWRRRPPCCRSAARNW